MPPLTGSTGGRELWDAKEKAPSNELLGALQYGGRCRNRTGVHGFAIRCITTLPTGLKTKAPHDFCGAILQTGAGNGTSTDALSVCFPTLFFAEGFNEGLNFSLVFERRQRRPSTNFHSPPTPSTHLRATPCQGSPLHRVRVARTECASQPCTADHAQDGARQSVAMSIYQDAVEVSPASPPPWPAPIKPHRRSAEASRLDPL